MHPNISPAINPSAGADKDVQFSLSMFSICKLILVKKKASLAFQNIVSYPMNLNYNLIEAGAQSSIDLMLRYIQGINSILLYTQFRWTISLPHHLWCSKPGVSRSRKSCTPFHKVVWELFSISIWAHSNDYVRSDQALGFHGGCFPALQAYIVPCASMFMSDHLFSVGKDIPQCPVDRDRRNRNNFVLALISAAENICSRLLCSKGYHDCDLETLAKWYPFGRLRFKLERAGKERVFAIPNAFKQALLRPAHDWCMTVLRLMPMDGTYDQTRPLRRLSSVRQLYSFDLSVATDHRW